MRSPVLVPLPFERQPDRHARPLADPALDRDVAPCKCTKLLTIDNPSPEPSRQCSRVALAWKKAFSQTRPQGALMRRHNSIPA